MSSNVEIIKPIEIIPGQACKFYNNTIYKTNEGYDIIILDYVDKYNVKIQYLYNGFITTYRMSNIIRGCVKNPFHPNKFGGYIGYGKYKCGKNTSKEYEVWRGILKRINNNNSRNNSYSKVSLCDEWYNYQNFAYWYDNYISSLNPDLYDEYEIDKDIVQWDQEYKIYSPSTCCLVPKQINMALIEINSYSRELPTGVYKHGSGYRASLNINGKRNISSSIFNNPEQAFEFYKNKKLEYIKDIANYYYSINAIQYNIYISLINLKINHYNKYKE